MCHMMSTERGTMETVTLWEIERTEDAIVSSIDSEGLSIKA